jgi:hypothetical protein
MLRWGEKDRRGEKEEKQIVAMFMIAPTLEVEQIIRYSKKS